MKTIVYGVKAYIPTLRADGKLDVRAMVAYGQVSKPEFILTVYVRCQSRGAGTRGGKEIQHFDIPVLRERVPYTTTQDEQLQRLTFMLNIVAVQQDCDYILRLPITTKATPKRAMKGER